MKKEMRGKGSNKDVVADKEAEEAIMQDNNEKERNTKKKKKKRRTKKRRRQLTNFRILYVNINGLKSKTSSLLEIVEEKEPTVIALVETKQSPKT